PHLPEIPLPETPPPVAPVSLIDAGEATTIEAGPSFEEETFIQSQEPAVELVDLSLPTPPTEETEAAAAIAMDELFGESQSLSQELAVSQEAVEAAARELASVGADLGFDEETFVQALEPPVGPELVPAAPEFEISDETFIQDLEAPEPPSVPELEALPLETPELETPETGALAEPWETVPEASEPEVTPDEMWADAADMVDDSWLQELGIAETEPAAEPEADFGLEAAPTLEPEADFGLEAATGSPEMATDALVDALLQADLEAELPPPEPAAPVPPAAAEPDFDDLSWATAAPDRATEERLELDLEPASGESDWDELSAFADTAQPSDPWEAVEATAPPDWLTEEETPAMPPTLETPEILEEFDPSLFADEVGSTPETAGMVTPAEDAFLGAFNEDELAAAPIALEADGEIPDTASSLDTEAAFAEFEAALFPDETGTEAAMPDLELGGLEEPTDTAEMPTTADPLAGLFSDTGLSTAELTAEIEDFMPTAVPEAEITASPTDAYDPLAALFDESESEDFAHILDVPEGLEGEDPLAAFDVDPFADEFSDAEEPT
ncbi:hypothetical protein, partial [Trichothermofontia sp.]